MAYICETIELINSVQTCTSYVIYHESWTEQLNNLSVVQVSALLSATALIWYVAWGIRTHLKLLGSED
ncbi:hypothetical protein F4V57_14675 [Acinetobacter qingfengensis]|uniref:Uncharacterized protein n=1 Tax=Acinetobacter qingfengensis TaxID=1262585 RepID=A0A1E7QZN5_9GAMM|nr:hypothetical protein [Acinetobacter qingfengensis]KAA8730793.1 hypothetical protein F4V57_14675 [Acinetobacter qingfengensis]OEY92537.1 hypothetical protein BJI46_14535 [Acinetobacter qingfengensis]